jgi:MinD superfamily P-loop ATPase
MSLSGKGGVGKSSITESLAVVASKNKKIICADCDVDASNLSIVLGNNKYDEWKDLSTNQKAEFNHDLCISCKRCKNACYFDAITFDDDKPRIKDFSCEGCGACELVCPVGAISLKKVNNAKVGYSITDYGFKVISAQLNPGESGSGKVVYEVKKKAENMSDGSEIMLIDAAAGIGCPVIASVSGSDYAIVVTEPTPSGFYDMKRAIDVIEHFGIEYSIIINKYDINEAKTKEIEIFAQDKGKKVIAKIPFCKSFSRALTEMKPVVEYDKDLLEIFQDIEKQVFQ